jgi:hypothetical protein
VGRISVMLATIEDTKFEVGTPVGEVVVVGAVVATVVWVVVGAVVGSSKLETPSETPERILLTRVPTVGNRPVSVVVEVVDAVVPGPVIPLSVATGVVEVSALELVPTPPGPGIVIALPVEEAAAVAVVGVVEVSVAVGETITEGIDPVEPTRESRALDKLETNGAAVVVGIEVSVWSTTVV